MLAGTGTVGKRTGLWTRELSSKCSTVIREAWVEEKRMRWKSRSPPHPGPSLGPRHRQVNPVGGYEFGRAPQAPPEARTWGRALHLGEDPGGTKREWSGETGREEAS